MLSIEKSITINAPVEQVFAYAIEPNHLPEYYTDVSAVQDVRRLPGGGYACKVAPHGAAIETTEVIPNERIVLRGNWCGPFDEVTSTTTFDRLDGEQTRVTCHEEHTFRGGFLARIGEKYSGEALGHMVEQTIASLKARVEATAPTGAPI